MPAQKPALLVLAVSLAAGCGGSAQLSKAQYQAKLRADAAGITRAVRKVNPDSLSTLAPQLAETEKAVAKAADDLGSAKPPSNVQADNTKIVAALRAIAAQFGKLKRAFDSGDMDAEDAAYRAFQTLPELKAAKPAVADLQAKGYEVGILAELSP